jgi:methyl-accepting chemotaxis protein
VRNLAQRSAAAAKEIKELIGDSVEKVDTGSRQVHVAGSTMNEVVKSIKQVTDIMGEITSASHEQSQGIDQINTVIIEMDTTTQQNSALVEEAAAASKALSDQTNMLMQVVSAFKINHNQRATDSKVASIRKTGPTVKPAAQSTTSQVTTKKPTPTLIKHEEKNAPNEAGWEEF